MRLDRNLCTAAFRREVHPDPEARAVADRAEQDLQQVATALHLSRPVFEAVRGVDRAADAITQRWVARTSARLPPRRRRSRRAHARRLTELAGRAVKLGQEFDQNIREDVRSVEIDPPSSRACREDYIAAHAPGADGKMTITTDYPDYIPFMTYAERPSARKSSTSSTATAATRRTTTCSTRCSRPPRAGDAARLPRLGRLRHRRQDDRRGARRRRVHRAKVADASRAARARATTRSCCKRKQQGRAGRRSACRGLGVGVTTRSASRPRSYDFDSQAMRRLLRVRAREGGPARHHRRSMFGIEYRKIADAPVWHPDVEAYDVHATATASCSAASTSTCIRARASTSTPRSSRCQPASPGAQLPEGALVCNFPDRRRRRAGADGARRRASRSSTSSAT